MEGTFYSKLDLRTNTCLLESLIVENITHASVWCVVITWICDELFRMGGVGGGWGNQPVLLKQMYRLAYFAPVKK